MTDDAGELDREDPVPRGQVGMADADRLDLDQYLARARSLDLDLLDTEVAALFGEQCRLCFNDLSPVMW